MAEKRKKKEEEKPGWQKSVLLYAHDMLYLLLIVMLLFLLVFRIIVVSGGSMRMTLLDGDYLLLLNNTFYHNPQRGDIVVISKESFDHGKPIVKRVIATEGQTVDINFETGDVSVDGEVLQDVGQIDKREVLGKAIFLMYPGTDDGTYPREFDRVGAIQ